MLQADVKAAAIFTLTLSIKIAQRPYIIGSLGPKALKYESFEGKVKRKGNIVRQGKPFSLLGKGQQGYGPRRLHLVPSSAGNTRPTCGVLNIRVKRGG